MNVSPPTRLSSTDNNTGIAREGPGSTCLERRTIYIFMSPQAEYGLQQGLPQPHLSYPNATRKSRRLDLIVDAVTNVTESVTTGGYLHVAQESFQSDPEPGKDPITPSSGSLGCMRAKSLYLFPSLILSSLLNTSAGPWQRNQKVTVQTIEKDMGDDLPGDVEQRNASVIITELPVPPPFVEMDDGRVFELLRNLSLAPHLLEECCEFCHQQGPTVLVDFRVDTSALDGLDGFEKVFHFIAVRIPLDFLNLLDHPGILHLPQPLLLKAPASKEGCFGGVSPKVHKCITELERRGGLNFEGVFRVPGSHEVVEAFRIALDKAFLTTWSFLNNFPDVSTLLEAAYLKPPHYCQTLVEFVPYCEGVDLSEKRCPDPNTITSLIKSFLRQLPIPLITYETYPEFIEAVRNDELSEEERLHLLRQTIQRLPPAHYHSLRYLMGHLNSPTGGLGVVKRSESTKPWWMRAPCLFLWSFSADGLAAAGGSGCLRSGWRRPPCLCVEQHGLPPPPSANVPLPDWARLAAASGLVAFCQQQCNIMAAGQFDFRMRTTGCRVAKNYRMNMMTSENLAIVFTPSLMSSSFTDPTSCLEGAKFEQAVVERMISDYARLFEYPPTAASPSPSATGTCSSSSSDLVDRQRNPELLQDPRSATPARQSSAVAQNS
ncbi:unnamed protein product [Schistocephalus solidus]|uniref:Rho-GAP domain-containing protein n=1 Tax=Schistocephalus solidus TaxID=70667 RepID=A0A183SYG9_SCHSO|nr:unnamed protein product [Schistocephalus solidus]